MVLVLVGANVAVYACCRLAGPTFKMNNFMVSALTKRISRVAVDSTYIHYLMMLLVHEQTSLDNFNSGRLHTLLTSAFSHKDVNHLLNNMANLYFFGSNVRSRQLFCSADCVF
jgi:membrane associated rhomboid family serine protease